MTLHPHWRARLKEAQASARISHSWTHTALYCLKSGQNCTACPVARIGLETFEVADCKMPEAVLHLLQRNAHMKPQTRNRLKALDA